MNRESSTESRRRAVCLLALVVLMTAGAFANPRSSGRAATARQTASAGRPNILFAIADDWSHGHAGVYGNKVFRTPAFDRVAREGVLFKNAFTSNPKCSPSRATMLTGRNAWQLEEAMCHNGLFRAKWPVYPDLLEAAGYLVGYTGKGWGPGDWKTGGFKRNPAGPEFSAVKTKPPHKGVSAVDYAANFKAFLKNRQSGQPFSFWYGGQEPHRPYEDGVGVRIGKNLKDVKLPSFYPDVELIRSDLLDYAVEVEWFDRHLGQMLDHLAEIGELDNTLIIVTSDHGMPFPRVKGQIYEEGYHLPLAIRWGARVKAGRTVDDFISARDFAPTLLETVGIALPGSITGRSFAGALSGDQSGWIDRSRDRVLIGKERHDIGRPNDWGYPVRALRTPEWLYVHNYHPERWPVGNPETGYGNTDNSPTKTLITKTFDEYYRWSFGKRPSEELYRIADDPDCVKNLATDAGLQTIKRQLREEMEKMLREDKDPRALGQGDVFDTYKYLGPRGHSYDSWLKYQQ